MLIKRILAALLCTATVTAMLASCGGGDTPAAGNPDTTTAGGDAAETTVAEETTTAELSAYDYLPEKNYDGKSYTVYTPDSGTRYLPGQIITTEETGDVIMDAAYVRNRNVEDKFNVEIKHITGSGSAYYTGIRSAVQAGDTAYDLTAGFLSKMADLGVEPIFIDATNLPYVDVENPWYGKANEALQINGKQSLFFSDYTCITLSCTYGLFYNKDLGSEYDVPDLTQTVIDGGWVIDDMLKYTQGVSKDLDGNGIFDLNDQYGNLSFTTHMKTSDTAVTYQYGMGNFTTVMGDDDLPVIALNNEKQYSIVQKLYTLFYEDNRTLQSTEAGKVVAPLFANGQGLFFNAIIMHAANYMRDMEDDYMVLPLPKYDEAQEQYYTMLSQTSSFLYGVPMSAADAEYSSIIFDALAYEGYKNVIPAFFEVSMKVKYSRDDLTSQVFDLLRDNTHVDFGLVYGGNGMSTLIGKVLAEKSTDFASAYASIEASAIDRYNKVIEQLTK